MWFEVAVVSTMFAVGNIVFGHFEEGTPKWRRIAKLALVMALGVAVSAQFGRFWFWAMLVSMALPVVYIHVWWLPRKGINGWTGEPKEKYYALRGWKLPAARGADPRAHEGAAE
jgi:uncharacterized membrane protein YfcA